MRQIKVKSRHGDYQVCVGERLIQHTGKLMKRLRLSGKVCIVTQNPVARAHLSKLQTSLRRAGFKTLVHTVPNHEGAKSQTQLNRLYRVLLKHGFERGDNLLALGGGVVGDLTGFAASSYLRGIPLVSIATTLLAQVDSSIGGKTGINLAEGKNLVGAFYPAKLVILDVSTLGTLSRRNYQASLAEVVKYGMIRDAVFFKYLERNVHKINARNMAVLKQVVWTSAKIKAGVVSRDEHETSGERMILNFGHTFGHAFEKVLGFRKLVHGEAVALGMVCATRLAVLCRMFSPASERRLLRLLEALKLPVTLVGLDIQPGNVLKAMSHDKKKKSGKLRFILPSRIGKVAILQDISQTVVRKAIVK